MSSFESSAGSLTHSRLSAGSGDATVVVAAPCQLRAVQAVNLNAAVRYIKIYDKATAPTSSDTPKLRIAIPPANRNEFCISGPGISFQLGIGYRLVTGVTDADNTAVAANEVIVNLAFT